MIGSSLGMVVSRMKSEYIPEVAGLNRNFCSICGKEFYTTDEAGPDLVCPDCFWESLFTQVRGGG